MKDLFYITLLFYSTITISFWLNLDKEEINYLEKGKIKIKTPKCVQMFYAIEKYANKYNIPKKYAYGIAYYETGYKGPFDWNYDPKQTSYAGALGPMQIMYSTSKLMFPNKLFSKEFLKNNIDFNVHCSMKLLRHLHDKYKDWEIVFGYYNTGKPIANSYSSNVINFKIKW